MSNLSKEISRRLPRAGWLPALAVFVPLGASADVISLFDEVTQNTVTPPVGVSYPAVTPEEMRTSFGHDTATVHVAIFDSVVSIAGGYWPYATAPSTATAGASVNAAAASAACATLRGLFPNRAPQYEPTCASYLAAIPDGDAKTRGIAIGSEVAAGTLALRANDGRMNPVVYVAGSDPGDFRGVNPVNVWLPFIRPFAMTSASQFRADGPPNLTSYTYAADLNEVKAYGGAVSSAAHAGAAGPREVRNGCPAARTPRNVRHFLSDSRSVVENSRLMALMWVTVADVTEACFDSMDYFDRCRPQSAIPLADTDGNDATVADAAWTPVVPMPNHPEYPAAHLHDLGDRDGAGEVLRHRQDRLRAGQRGAGPGNAGAHLSRHRRHGEGPEHRAHLRWHALPHVHQGRHPARQAGGELGGKELLQEEEGEPLAPLLHPSPAGPGATAPGALP